MGIWRHQTAGGDQRIFSDARTVQNSRADADEASLLDVTAVNRCRMPYGDLVFDNGRKLLSAGNMNDSAVLDVGSRTNADKIDIAPQNAVIPNIRIFADLHITDDDGIFGNKSSRVDFGGLFKKDLIIFNPRRFKKSSRRILSNILTSCFLCITLWICFSYPIVVPNNAPIAAVAAIARAPQKVTRKAPVKIFEPPTLAAIPPKTARNMRDEIETAQPR